MLHPLEYAPLLTAARHDCPQSHALAALLGMLGLRISEAYGANVTDLHADSGYELLTITGKGHKPAQIPLPPPLGLAGRPRGHRRAECRPAPAKPRRSADDPRCRGRAAAAARVRIGLEHPVSPRSLRRTFCTAGLVCGVPLRDVQYAIRHSDSRTTLRYDMSRSNLDRHAAHPVAAYLAGMAVG